ncbi:MAG: pirin family protein [Candidatus Woesearchaeota archaeon]|nr:pirin family protein [Candidatus Woesearchaeota archaeon]
MEKPDIIITRADGRGITKADWLTSFHSFSFNRYHDPSRMGFGKLRVFNDDHIAAGKGFGEHSHDNMEIVTVILGGEAEHKDSSGGGGVLRPGDVQVMSAGSGITHSEFNHSDTKPLDLIQIWIETAEMDIEPRYDQMSFDLKEDTLTKVVSEGDEGNLHICQDASIYIGKKNKGIMDYRLKKGRGMFLFMIEGKVKIEGNILERRDSIEMKNIGTIKVEFINRCEFVLIDVPISQFIE